MMPLIVNANAERASETLMSKKWYVIQTYSGYENKVRESLQQRIKEHLMEARFGEVLIPTESVTEARAGGKSRTRQKTSFPGYIFVEMEMSEDAWHIVKDTPKVTGFIGNQQVIKLGTARQAAGMGSQNVIGALFHRSPPNGVSAG